LVGRYIGRSLVENILNINFVGNTNKKGPIRKGLQLVEVAELSKVFKYLNL